MAVKMIYKNLLLDPLNINKIIAWFSLLLIAICQKVRILNQKSGYMDKITEVLSFSKYILCEIIMIPADFRQGLT